MFLLNDVTLKQNYQVIKKKNKEQNADNVNFHKQTCCNIVYATHEVQKQSISFCSLYANWTCAASYVLMVYGNIQVNAGAQSADQSCDVMVLKLPSPIVSIN